MMLLTPNPKMGDRIKAKDYNKVKSPQLSTEFTKANGSTIMVLTAPARTPITIFIVLAYPCLAIMPNVFFFFEDNYS